MSLFYNSYLSEILSAEKSVVAASSYQTIAQALVNSVDPCNRQQSVNQTLRNTVHLHTLLGNTSKISSATDTIIKQESVLFYS